MKKYLLIISLLVILPNFVGAVPTTVNRLTDHLEPLIQTDYFRAQYLNATSTSATSTFSGALVASTSQSYLADASSHSVITAWGDSLTSGSGSTGDTIPYTFYLQRYLINKPVGVRNMGIASQTAVQTLARMSARPDTWDDYTIIWIGTNDIGNGATTTVTANVQSMVARLDPLKRFLVMGTMPYDTWTCNTTQGKDLVAVNAALLAAFPNNFFNILTYLQGLQPADPNVALCLTPTVYYADTIHLNDAGYLATAQGVSTQINAQLAGMANKVLTQNSAKGVGAVALNVTGIYALTTQYLWLAGSGITQTYGTNQAFDYGVGNNILQYRTTGQYNNAMGDAALRYLTTGSYNNGFGDRAGAGVTGGSGNNFFGKVAGYITTGSANNVFGYQAGLSLTSGNGNIIIGPQLDVLSATGNGQMNIGAVLYGTGLFYDINSSQGTAPIAGGRIGVGTTTPWRAFSVNGSSDLGTNALAGYFTATTTTASSLPYASSTAISVSSLTSGNCVQASTGGLLTTVGVACGSGSGGGGLRFWVLTTAPDTNSIYSTALSNVGIGTTSPYAKLSVGGQVVANNFTATSTTATSTFWGDVSFGGTSNGLTYQAATATTTVSNLVMGSMSFDTNAGLVTAFELPITSAATNNTPEGYSFSLMGSTTLSLYGLAAGNGFAQSGWPRVAIGSSTIPYSTLTVFGSGTGTGGVFEIANSASSTLMKVLDNGTVTFPSATATTTFTNDVKAGDYVSSDGSYGFTGTCTILGLTSISVKNGLIVGCQ